tara:strand:- start:251 stop:985 length:735 start_codon:yes stop_codon:yes gene_type:complete
MTIISAVNTFRLVNAKPAAVAQNSTEKPEPTTAVRATSPLSAKETTGTKTIYEVAANARAALDSSYEETGLNPENYRHRTGSFRREMFDAMNFDRRTLFAIASDQGGQFSEEEVKAAKSVMHDQLAAPLVAASAFPSEKNTAAAQLAMIEFLDTQTSPEEKASLDWAKERAAAQASYQLQTRGHGQQVGSDDPIVNLLLNAYDELFAAFDSDMNERLENMPSYSRALEEWAELNSTSSSFSITV